MTHDFPTFQELTAIHEILIGESGGAEGIQDEGALIYTLMGPQPGYYDILIREAAAYMERLANNHPFVDGNKRGAFFGIDTFLRMNGCFNACDNKAAYAYIIGLFEANSLDNLCNKYYFMQATNKPLP